MRVGIYIRVSTDEQASSAEEQERGALAWCAKHGHEVAVVYRDVGYSGAEWSKRPGVLDLQVDARRKPAPWDMLVVRDADRLGRDGIRLPLLLSTLSARGLRAVAWSTGETLTAGDATGRLIVSVRAGIAEIEREQIAHRTRTAHRTRAERGLVVGASVYGYDHERTADGVRYVIVETEAAVVRDIYRRHGTGESARTIAMALNDCGAPTARTGPRGPGMWTASTVLRILRSPRYRGEGEWGRVGGSYVEGTRVVDVRSDANVVTYACPAIVDARTWQRAQERADAARAIGRRPRARGHAARHMLIGLAVCGSCGGPVGSSRTGLRRGEHVAAYCCLRRRDGGASRCPASWCRATAELDLAVRGWLAGEVLDAHQIGRAVARARSLASEDDGRAERIATVEARVRDLESRVGRLRAALEIADDVAEVVASMRARSAELVATRATLAAQVAEDNPVASLELERDLLDAARELAASLEAQPELTRAVLATVLDGSIVVSWQGPRAPVLLSGRARLGALLSGAVGRTGMRESPPDPAHTRETPDAGTIPLCLEVGGRAAKRGGSK